MITDQPTMLPSITITQQAFGFTLSALNLMLSLHKHNVCHAFHEAVNIRPVKLLDVDCSDIF